MSNRKIEELQGEIISMDYEIAALMQIYEKLCINNSAIFSDDGLTSYNLEPLPDAVSLSTILLFSLFFYYHFFFLVVTFLSCQVTWC